ncbi:hypothetical protein LTR15_008402 [Elasticomyces elasticus]|nr:hypothetical protein LTR15_008402 [Elasticomyces elasticus]
MAADEVIEIAPHGDVLLLCSEEIENAKTIGLRVSSHVMSLASPVFRVLLAPKFREGVTLAAATTVDIPLPDNPDDMLVLCNVFHMRHDKVQPLLSANQLLRCAQLCDKYDCVMAMRPSFEVWVNVLAEVASLRELAILLTAMVLLGYQGLVASIGARLILDADGLIDDLVQPEQPKSVSICAELDKARLAYLLEASEIIENAVEFILYPDDGRDNECDWDCPATTRRVTRMIMKLREVELWPTKIRSKVLGEVVKTIEDLQVRDPRDLKFCKGIYCGHEEEEEIRSLESVSLEISGKAKALRSRVGQWGVGTVLQ